MNICLSCTKTANDPAAMFNRYILCLLLSSRLDIKLLVIINQRVFNVMVISIITLHRSHMNACTTYHITTALFVTMLIPSDAFVVSYIML